MFNPTACFTFILFFTLNSLSAQPLKNGGGSSQSAGVAVSPSKVNFNVRPGKSSIKTIKVTNDTKKTNKFKVTIKDFTMNDAGKSSFVEPGKGKFGLSKWMNISPTFFELKPGEVKEVTVNVQVPDSEEGQQAAWSILIIEQAEEKKALDPGNKGGNTIAFGITPTFAFGVWIYQNPPNVSVNKVEIVDYKHLVKDGKEGLIIKAKNKGTGISFCTSYVHLTNLNTGEQRKLLVKKFTILPENTREFRFALPDNLPKGKYQAQAILDYGSSDEIPGAVLEFTK